MTELLASFVLGFLLGLITAAAFFVALVWIDGKDFHGREKTARESVAGTGDVLGPSDVGRGDTGHDHLEARGGGGTPGTGETASPAEAPRRDEPRPAGGADGGGDRPPRGERIEVSKGGYERWKRQRAEARATQDSEAGR